MMTLCDQLVLDAGLVLFDLPDDVSNVFQHMVTHFFVLITYAPPQSTALSCSHLLKHAHAFANKCREGLQLFCKYAELGYRTVKSSSWLRNNLHQHACS